MTHKPDPYASEAETQALQEFPLRSILASELKCWHRLTEEEADNLVAFVKNSAPQPAPVQKDPTANFRIENGMFAIAAKTLPDGVYDLYAHPRERKPLTPGDVRKAGGIVHGDGNIFFTSIDQLNAAIKDHP